MRALPFAMQLLQEICLIFSARFSTSNKWGLLIGHGIFKDPGLPNGEGVFQKKTNITKSYLEEVQDGCGSGRSSRVSITTLAMVLDPPVVEWPRYTVFFPTRCVLVFPFALPPVPFHFSSPPAWVRVPGRPTRGPRGIGAPPSSAGLSAAAPRGSGGSGPTSPAAREPTRESPMKHLPYKVSFDVFDGHSENFRGWINPI